MDNLLAITDVEIQDVDVGPDSDNRICARIHFSSTYCYGSWYFMLSDLAQWERLQKLLEYTVTSKVHCLTGRKVRAIIAVGGPSLIFCGFGHPTEDKFVLTYSSGPTQGNITKTVELTEHQIKEAFNHLVN